MPVASARSAVAAFGKQSAEGSALATPKFETPMGGGFAGPTRNTEELPWTSETQDAVGDYVSNTAGTVDMTLPVLPISSVALFEAVLGSRATTGSGPYTHAITPSDTLPFFTWFFAQPGGNYWVVSDVKSGSSQLSWSPGSPLELSVTGQGKATTRSGAKWGAGATVEPVEPFYTYIGATMKFEHGTTPATTQVRTIAGGSVTIERNLDAIQTDEITNRFLVENKRDITVSLDDVVFENNDLINSIFTGSASGTSVSGTVVYGSCDFTFLGSDQAAAATRSLVISVPKILWTVDQVPAADPGGQTLRYTVTGRAAKPSSGASITATVINASEGTVYA